MKKIFKISLMMLMATAGLTMSAATKQNVLTLKETLSDNDIVFPYSFMTDTHAMMNNWYLQNYAVLDKDVEKRSSGEVSEEEYIRRLKAIPTTIELPYNQVVRAHIDRYTKKGRTLVEQMLGMSLYYMPIFEEALEREQLPQELKYIPIIESAMNPEATSPAGAAGLWQFMTATGKSLGLEVNTLVDERRDPYLSSDRAAKFFKQLYEVYGDWSLAIAAYNCGPGNVNKAIVRSGNDHADFWAIYNYLPKETRGYVPAFIAATYVMNYYDRHNISPAKARKPLITDTVTVNRRVHFNQIASVLNIPIEELRVLNPQYRRDIIPGDVHPYRLILPSQQVYSYIMAEDKITRYQQEEYGRRGRVEPGTGDYEINEDDNFYPEATPGDLQPTIDASQAFASTGSSRTSTSADNNRVAPASASVPARSSASSSSASTGNISAGFHKVQRGETLASIAENYGMDPSDLMSLNGLTSSQVRTNQILKVQKHVAAGTTTTNINRGNDYTAEAASGITSARPGDYDSTIKNVPASSSRTATASTPVPERPRQNSANTAQQTVPERPRQAATTASTGNSTVTPASTGKKTGTTTAAATTKSSKNSKNNKNSKTKNTKAAAPKTTTVTVKDGDNLTTIAKKNGTTVEQLKKDNNIKGDMIRSGQTLKVNKPAATTTGKGKKGKK